MSEFVRIAMRVLMRLDEERPRVVVRTYTDRRAMVEKVIRNENPDSQLTDVMAYVNDTKELETHRVGHLVNWVTGYA